MKFLQLFVAVLVAFESAQAAEVFEKIGTPRTISPTGIPYTVPAAARAAGWTIVSPPARLGLAGSNPAFLRGLERAEVDIDGMYEYQDAASSTGFDRYQARFTSAAGKIDIGRVSAGLAYERPYASEYQLPIFISAPTTVEEDLEVWLGGAAVEVQPGLIVAGSLAWQRADGGATSREAYQATVGAALEFEPGTLAAAFKSEPFGADADELVAPAWLQVDGRLALRRSFSIGGRLGLGWWNDTRSGVLRSPIDAGVGVDWQVHRLCQVLAGVHTIRSRIDESKLGPASADFAQLLDLGQGSFLDAGLVFGVPDLQAALSVEDSHAFDPNVQGTWVSLSLHAGY